MAHAKKVNFHVLSQIVFPADFGPGVQGPLAEKGQNWQTYNAQFHQEPSKYSAKLLGQPSAWTLTCQNWTWTAGPLKKVQLSNPTIQGFEDRSKIPTQGDGPCKKSKLSFPKSNCIPSRLWSRGPGTFCTERSKWTNLQFSISSETFKK